MRPAGQRAAASTAAPLRAGVVGLGEIGQFHLQGFARAANAAVVAVADLDEALCARTAAERASRAYAGYEELFEDPAVDVVSICLPHALHRPAALAAIGAGKHVLVEKPLALTAGECQDIIDAAARASVTVGVQHNQLFYPPHVRAKELVDSGVLGRPVHLRLRLGIGGKFGGWRADPALTGGGLLFDAGVHRFYLARHLFGEIAQVVAVTDAERSVGEDQAVVALRFENGALGVIDANYHGPKGMFDDAVEVVGSDGALYLSGCEAEFEGFRTGPSLRLYDGAWHDVRVPPGNWADSVAASIAAFVDAVAAQQAPPVSLEDGRRILELIEAVHDRPSTPAPPSQETT
jgi:UDP-N-acetylglucosamine 3-dehydrogenase